MSQQPQHEPMSEGRALLTERERSILAGDADVTSNYKYKVESLARSRVRQLASDVEVLREEHPEIYGELREIVCKENTNDE